MTLKGFPKWPPLDGKEFIRSEAFGLMLVELTRDLAAQYPQMEFIDAVAQVFVWFDQKLSENRRFINPRRFPSVAALKAYLRQAVWNAARGTGRKRRRLEAIEALPVDEAIVSGELSAEDKVHLLELVQGLPEPHKTVFERYFLDEEDLAMIASLLHLTQAHVWRTYEEAVDMLYEARTRDL